MCKTMIRFIVCLILTSGIVLTTAGCSIVTSFLNLIGDCGDFPKDKYEVIESPNKEDYSFAYNSENYYYVEDDILIVDTEKIEPVLISWKYNFPFSTYSLLYSYGYDSPYYIYNSDTRQPVYINEKYDYKSDVFVLENTGVEVKFSDVFIQENTIEYDTFRPHVAMFNLCLKSHPEVYASASVFLRNATYYVGFNTEPLHQIAPAFLRILIENGIIS